MHARRSTHGAGTADVTSETVSLDLPTRAPLARGANRALLHVGQVNAVAVVTIRTQHRLLAIVAVVVLRARHCLPGPARTLVRLDAHQARRALETDASPLVGLVQ
eukprot:2491185-Rhodomonas_salina.2